MSLQAQYSAEPVSVDLEDLLNRVLYSRADETDKLRRALLDLIVVIDKLYGEQGIGEAA